MWSNSSGCHVRYYDKHEFDAVAVYCPDSWKCYYVRVGEVKGKVIVLRVSDPKQIQKNMTYAKDLEDVNRIFGGLAESGNAAD